MAVLSWGKPRIFYKLSSATTWKEAPTPVEDSTELTTEKGDKTEAKIEGGANEDVRYGKNTYALTFTIRATKGRKKLMPDVDGIINGTYSIALIPEDATIEGFKIDSSAVSIEDGWTAADGATWIYTFDALQPEDGTKQVKRGVLTPTGEGDNVTISFTEVDEEDEE